VVEIVEEKEKLESIKYHIELIRLIWVTILAIGGGSIGVLASIVTGAGAKIVLAGVGLLVAGLLGGWIILLDRRTRTIIASLTEVPHA
jgi:hypothetical protein